MPGRGKTETEMQCLRLRVVLVWIVWVGPSEWAGRIWEGSSAEFETREDVVRKSRGSVHP